MAKLEGVKTLDMVNGEITKVAYGGAAYERVEGEGTIGDLVLIKDGWTYATKGEFYETVGRDSDRDVKIIDDDGEENSNYRTTYELFRKVATTTNPSVEERVAKAEDEIESLKSEVAALKGEAEYKRISVDEAQDGDYVKFDEAPRGYLTAGKYYEIDYIDSNGDPRITDDDGDDFDTFCLDDDEFGVYRKVSAAEPKPERLKVGDYAKVVNATDYHSFHDGDIVEIVEDPFTGPINECARKITDVVTQYVPKRQLVRATDEEITEAKRAAAEHKKWAEIGREVGEYKKGDVVRYDYGDNEICEVVDDTEDGRVGVQTKDYGICRESPATLRLITPFEARFDR
ncbi:hypothetical protein MOC78_03330 [Bacillus inaquosorum]|uniref:hypothetical protein n=1 Tax=Bacillus inaquosorum TaxID=483913 RepID=UPI00228091C4|nr:hypothetical protein [Bacillus inaquosorum]MCY8386510.1 hypothetical protein [Bacillus inaquosorum]